MTATNTQQHKNSGNYAEHLLKPCPIHAHHKLKNFFTRGLHNTHCLHRSAIAPWLHKEPKRRWLCYQNILWNVEHHENKGQKITHKVINFKKFFKNTKSCQCQRKIISIITLTLSHCSSKLIYHINECRKSYHLGIAKDANASLRKLGYWHSDLTIRNLFLASSQKLIPGALQLKKGKV
jgi:hypothetical protein